MKPRPFLLALLKGLEAAVPPPPNCHHAITYAQYGSNAEGWQDRLALQVNVAGTFWCFFIDDGDDDPKAIIDFVVKDLSQPTAKNAQEGVGLGQYLPIANV